MKPIRFAPIIRVSTEGQKKKGESLLTQKAQIIKYVSNIPGVIPNNCWKYVGQEHATPDHERALLDQLLKDSEKGLFDAVIVCDVSRWSRDNLKSKIGLKTLRDNGIRFFASTMEYDLYNPEHEFILGMSVETNQFLARQQAKKSMENRLHRAKRGIPATGELPFGRIFNKKTETWSLDKTKARQIRDVAKRYLQGESLLKLSRELGMTHQNLANIFRDRCGDKWTVRFKGGKEPVTFNIPRLLPDDTIQQLRDRLSFKRNWSRHEVKQQYLLSGFIRCESCGSTLTGQTQYFKGGQASYYQHLSSTTSYCKAFSSIRCEGIEHAVFSTIFENIVDIPSFEKAIAESLPDEKMIADLKRRIEANEKRLSSVQHGLDRLVQAVISGTLTKDTISKKEKELIEAKTELEITLQLDRTQLSTLPDIEAVKSEAKKIRRQLLEYYSGAERIQEMTFEEKRTLIHWLFDGRDKKGTPYGIYITKHGKRKQTKLDYFLYGRIVGLRTLKGENIDYLEDEDNYKSQKVVNY